MKKRVLITGSNGLLGQKLVELLSQEPSIELIATAKGNNRLNVSSDYSYVSLDITQEEEVNQVFEEYQPNMVIHTAAMTNVDACETDPEGCEQLNVTAVEYLICASEKYNTFFCHLSTDFIFDGANGLRLAVERRIHRRRMAFQRQPAYRLGLDAGRQRLVRGIGPGLAGLPQLGPGYSARGPDHRRFFCQPHTAVRRTAVYRHLR